MVHAQASILILGAGSLFIFDRMKFDMAWLTKPINDWQFDSGFQELKAFVYDEIYGEMLEDEEVFQLNLEKI